MCVCVCVCVWSFANNKDTCLRRNDSGDGGGMGGGGGRTCTPHSVHPCAGQDGGVQGTHLCLTLLSMTVTPHPTAFFRGTATSTFSPPPRFCTSAAFESEKTSNVRPNRNSGAVGANVAPPLSILCWRVCFFGMGREERKYTSKSERIPHPSPTPTHPPRIQGGASI